MGLKQTSPAVKPEDRNTFDYLRLQIDEVCSEIAKKFNLYDSRDKPRKAFILDVLLRYPCPGCIVKVLSQPHRRKNVDSIYNENHRLAVNLLVDRLRHRLSEEGFNVTVQNEVNGEYGRVDVLIKPMNCEVMLEFEVSETIVEVKTGRRLSYAQLFRYLVERPNATVIVWRVKMRQILFFEGRKMKRILMSCMETVIHRGIRVLNEETPSCSHNPISGKTCTIENPQKLIEGFTSALMETLPEAVDTVLGVLKASSPAGPGGETVEA